ncbi:MAG TPA: DUF5818 domain-containing protein [Terriglobales bacterium]|nr:DUF5818 domain-containing protein [Terriglobales bacterium]
MKPMLLTFLLLGLTLAWGQKPQSSGSQGGNSQMSDQTNAYPAQNNTPGSRMGTQSLSQSTIEGCLMGSGDRFILTDEHEGTIYLLSGNDSLLKGHVGQQVAITGVAGNIEPSNQPGQPGYINPSAPDKEGAAGTRMGAKSKSFEVQYVQQEAAQCHSANASQADAIAASNAALGSVANSNSGAAPQVGYTAGGDNGLQGCLSGGPGNYMLSQPNLRRQYKVEGDQSKLQPQVGHTVQLTGNLQPGEAPVFKADNVQQLAASCNYRSNESPQATGGKTGSAGDRVPVSSTASAGTVTPGYQTQAGEAQNPQDKAALNAGGANPPQHNTEKNGAPTPNEQIGEDRASAARMANAAHKGEIGGYESGNYGLNGNAPDYSQAKGQPPATQSAQNNAPGSAAENTQNQKGQGSEGGMAANRDQKPNRTTLTGCLEGTKNGHQFTLRTEDGRSIRLQGTRDELKDHLNHTVQVVGEQGGSSPQHRAVAGHNGEQGFTVDGINDLAPTCGGSGK